MATTRPMSNTLDQWIDPALHALVDEQRGMNRKLIDAGANNPPPGAVPPEKIRRARREGRGAFPAVVLDPNASDATIEADPSVRVRHHPNPEASAFLVHVHGGGWVFGSPDEVDTIVGRLAMDAACEAISVDYRLAPEHPFPAGRNDVMVAIEWALDEAARLGLDRVIVAGESSGAHLALSAVLELGPAALRERGLVGLSLAFGFFDVGLSPSARNWAMSSWLFRRHGSNGSLISSSQMFPSRSVATPSTHRSMQPTISSLPSRPRSWSSAMPTLSWTTR